MIYGAFRKKSVIIQAFQVPPPLPVAREVPPRWVIDAIVDGTLETIPTGGVRIRTLEGVMVGNVGDWVIKGVKGELYPCKPDIFAATYDAVVGPE